MTDNERDDLQFEVAAMQARLALLETRAEEWEGRASRASDGVRAISSDNLKQDSAIAIIFDDVKALKEALAKAAKERADTAADIAAIKDAVVGVVTNAKVRMVGRALFVLAAAYLAGKGIKVLP